MKIASKMRDNDMELLDGFIIGFEGGLDLIVNMNIDFLILINKIG